MVYARYRMVYLHLALGLFIIPFGLGHIDFVGDGVIRLPAILAVAVDAATAFTIALNYTYRIWPYRNNGFVPAGLRWGFFHPAFAWLASIGYYMVCLWVVMAIIQAPDAPVGDWILAMLFVLGFIFIAIYKLALVRFTDAIAIELERKCKSPRDLDE